ncbi:MAG: alpha-hydroxy-acid oxidizing protein [Mycobacteriales bacterium]
MGSPADYQYEIYLAGLAGDRPQLPTNLDELESFAEARLPAEPFGYVAGGAATEATVRANRAAFDRWRLLPRMLRDVGERRLGREVLGTRLPVPVLLAPIGVQSILHPDGELATARAAAGTGMAMVASTASSYPLESVAEELGQAPRWFQLYWPRDPELTASLLQRAHRAGFSVLVVTLDTWLLAWRPRDLAGAYLPFLAGTGCANYFSDPVFRAALAAAPEEDLPAAVRHFLGVYSDPTKTWADLATLREQWPGAIVLKGVLHPDDARRALDLGMDGVAVSNHGGRQVDGAVAALDALTAVVAAVAGRGAVIFDGGVRSGADVLKALALGADAAMLGRPYAYGLGLAGEAGVRHVIRSILADLDLTLALCGLAGVDEIDAALLRPSP